MELDQKKEDRAVDPSIADWNGPNDPKNLMKWPPWNINAHIFLVSAITFIRFVGSFNQVNLTKTDP